ncbi:MAG: N-acetylmuramoyl-L-alanine amidase, partial [Cycloclasticus sp.]|nr:N-acetylmuramoyl-L-alanine amidase [Cycloclasticus sp.]
MKLFSKSFNKIRFSLSLLLAVALLTLGVSVQAAANKKIDSLRFWTAPDHTRLVLGITSPVEHKVFSLDNPPRLVVDLDGVQFSAKIPDFSSSHKVISLVRHAPRNKNDLRVVIDLKTPVSAKSFLLKPNADYGHRLVIDLYPKQAGAKQAKMIKKTASGSRPKKWVVAIDAGHGGEDPGAKGYRGTREKVVVLAIAKKLAALIDKQPNMKAYLVRSGDYYIGLRKRMEKARRAKADLFISIHADAFKDQRA